MNMLSKQMNMLGTVLTGQKLYHRCGHDGRYVYFLWMPDRTYWKCSHLDFRKIERGDYPDELFAIDEWIPGEERES